ncbi:MAG TPA: hypothetical protein VH228_17820 [Nocardioides sp.]|nr:hypothetical protein [Nocardioides sp.]
MLTPGELSTWLNDVMGLDIPFLPAPQPVEPIAPDVIGLVMPSPGQSPDVDGLFETQGFQLQVRGPQSRTYSEQAYVSALAVDVALRFWDMPVWIGATYVTSILRPGGPPQLVSPRPSSAERLTYSASYLFHVTALPQ